MFSLIRVWINGRVNNREAGDLRRHRGHYDVIVMNIRKSNLNKITVHIFRWRRELPTVTYRPKQSHILQGCNTKPGKHESPVHMQKSIVDDNSVSWIGIQAKRK